MERQAPGVTGEGGTKLEAEGMTGGQLREGAEQGALESERKFAGEWREWRRHGEGNSWKILLR